MRCSFFFFFVSAALPLLMLLLLFPAVPVSSAFQQNPFGIVVARSRRRSCVPIFAAGDGGPSSWREGDGLDSNEWSGSGDDLLARRRDDQQPDWQDELKRKSDGSFWSAFEPSSGEEEEEGGAAAGGSAGGGASASAAADDDVDAEADAWLETLASLSAEEVQFNLKEADRADKVRQMQEWGFADETIGNTLGVATDLSLEETDDGVDAGMREYRKESYLDEVDLEQVESHSTVEVDDETGEPVRSQMVYVDEHTCIGCTNCAMIAQSTFFMHSEHGRARVFQQWGDDDETIQVVYIDIDAVAMSSRR
jgi:ferredoxin